nr:uncharacterized protein LOC110073237 isoform X2 [Pogona vitticeps]
MFLEQPFWPPFLPLPQGWRTWCTGLEKSRSEDATAACAPREKRGRAVPVPLCSLSVQGRPHRLVPPSLSLKWRDPSLCLKSCRGRDLALAWVPTILNTLPRCSEDHCPPRQTLRGLQPLGSRVVFERWNEGRSTFHLPLPEEKWALSTNIKATKRNL